MASVSTTHLHPVSQRERDARRALRDAALKLFASNGFDATNVSAIANKAGVSTRIVLRYFPTKESVFYSGAPGWLNAVLDIYPTQPTTLSDLEALSATMTDLAPRVQRSRMLVMLYQRAVERSLALRGHDDEHLHGITEVLALAIAARRGEECPDEGCRLLAAVALSVYRRALVIWLSGPTGSELAAIVRTEFEILGDQLSSCGG
jgi:AcrR family transcriptional regulator